MFTGFFIGMLLAGILITINNVNKPLKNCSELATVVQQVMYIQGLIMIFVSAGALIGHFIG